LLVSHRMSASVLAINNGASEPFGTHICP
jgi:hypothetical protein